MSTQGTKYYLAIQSAKKKYGQDNDHEAYLADCLHIALEMSASELAAANPRFRHLPGGIAAARWAIKGVVGQIAHQVSDRSSDKHATHEDFLAGVAFQIKKHFNRELEPVKETLTSLGLWPER